jgi:hypothetical protein
VVLGAVALVAALAAIPYLLLGGLLAKDTTQEYLTRESFDAVAWRDREQIENAARIRMVDHLLDHHDLASKTRSEVVELLGEPDRTEYFRDWDMVFWLGPERSFFSIDSEWLVLRLDPDSRVVEYRVVRD